MAQPSVAMPKEQPGKWTNAIVFVLGVLFVFAMAYLARQLNIWGDKAMGNKVVEFPVWAAGLGLALSVVIGALGIREKVSAGFRTEMFLKTGLVLMGAGVNVSQIMSIGIKGMLQAAILITCVFFFTWWLCGLFKVDEKLRALMSASVSICGVSAAIAASGAVLAKKEHLAYVTTLVILFALPLMFIMPWAAKAMNLSTDVAGAWIGGNIDTTAAVVGAGAMHSDAAMKVASIVKMSQNALIGFAAFGLALYWVMVVERTPEKKPSPIEIWNRFPKFVLGFIGASILASFGFFSAKMGTDIKNIQTIFLMMAFVSIGLEFAFGELRKLGMTPILIYFFATVFNACLGLLLSYLIFGGILGI